MAVKSKLTLKDRIRNFWINEKAELKKVLWPDRDKVLKLSLALGVMLIFLIALIAFYDFIFSALTSLILGRFAG
ncbi:MAG: preprotein translocase subunit SecE [Dictyoglomus sp. NZ13-RE01]|nr:MAG: preprotein translocase subunit SecE [Dictyoglomus sp. NZ13-RE01]